MKLETLQELRRLTKQRLDMLDAIVTACRGCKHFEDGKSCSKWQVAPPPEVRDTPGACADWTWDEVPF